MSVRNPLTSNHATRVLIIVDLRISGRDTVIFLMIVTPSDGFQAAGEVTLCHDAFLYQAREGTFSYQEGVNCNYK